jgi:hypothetical protein
VIKCVLMRRGMPTLQPFAAAAVTTRCPSHDDDDHHHHHHHRMPTRTARNRGTKI